MSTAASDTPAADRQMTESARGRRFVNALDQSELAGPIQELIVGWLARHDQAVAKDVLAERLQASGAKLGVGDLLEPLTECYLRQHPTLMSEYQRGELSLGRVAEQAIDEVFREALEANASDERQEQRTQLTKWAEKFRILSATLRQASDSTNVNSE